MFDKTKFFDEILIWSGMLAEVTSASCIFWIEWGKYIIPIAT